MEAANRGLIKAKAQGKFDAELFQAVVEYELKKLRQECNEIP